LSRRYIVLGNGIAGQTCAEELRKIDPESSIVMIAAERHPLYNRVALPRYLRGQVREEKVLMRTVADYEKRALEIHFETWATEIDPQRARYVNDNLADYSVPVNADIKELEVILVPEEDHDVNPAGVKGLGELANVGTAAAIANAVYHATGKRLRKLPIRIEDVLTA